MRLFRTGVTITTITILIPIVAGISDSLIWT